MVIARCDIVTVPMNRKISYSQILYAFEVKLDDPFEQKKKKKNYPSRRPKSTLKDFFLISMTAFRENGRSYFCVLSGYSTNLDLIEC